MYKPVTALVALISAASMAQVTYTASQLHQMIGDGSPPRQRGSSSETRTLAFADCVKTIEQTLVITKRYPSKTLVDTRALRVVKIWANDAALTTTCSADDRKMTITTSPYQ